MNNLTTTEQGTPLTPEIADHIRTLPQRFPSHKRDNLFALKQMRETYEQVWNSNGLLRSRAEDRAGHIGDFYKDTLPNTADEMFTAWASLPHRLNHLHYTTSWLTSQIEQNNLTIPHPSLTAEEMGLLISVHYLIDRSFNGFTHERRLLDYLNSEFGNDLNARFATGAEDKQYGVDLFVDEVGFAEQQSYGIQVKPVSFFRGGDRNSGLKRDRNRLFSQIRKTEAQDRITVKWHIYDGEFPFHNPQQKLLLTTDEAYALAT